MRVPAPEVTAGRVRGAGVPARRLVVIASSTGGPGALDAVIGRLPAVLGAGVLVVQHMPAGFTTSLAARLDAVGSLPCHEGVEDDLIADDRILLAPGDRHVTSSESGRLRLSSLPHVNGVRPAADVTLRAVAPFWGDRLLAVVLTGMGVDARDGARAVKVHGGCVIAQDRETSAIWGMPGAIVEAGLADSVLPLEHIADAIASWAAGDPVARSDR